MIATASRRVLNEVQAAEYLNLSHRTLQKLRVIGGGPGYVKIGRLVRYKQEALETYLNDRERRNTSDES